MPKIIIIGGGIAGLSAGIYARKCGFECEIYEKHVRVGESAPLGNAKVTILTIAYIG